MGRSATHPHPSPSKPTISPRQRGGSTARCGKGVGGECLQCPAPNGQSSSAPAAGRDFLCKWERSCLEVVGLVESNRQFSSASAARRGFL
jgi:hypothetical protein